LHDNLVIGTESVCSVLLQRKVTDLLTDNTITIIQLK